MNISKNKVYVGEGFRVKLAFYVAENNTIKMDFADDLDAQVDAISKKIKSPDCLEQRILISDLKGIPTVVNGKKYLSYQFFEAIYFPLNNKPINIPAVELRMIQTNKNAKEGIIFKDTPQKISVLDLPEHPLKDKVSAGNLV